MKQSMMPSWLPDAKKHLSNDVIAGMIVGILVLPQSMGYALIAGLPPVYGLYAAIVPVLIYAWIGSSSAIAVGPVAIIAIMTAQALRTFDVTGAEYIALCLTLSFMSGCILLAASWLKLGWITQFISRGVTAGFISGAGILIGLSQLKYVTGTTLASDTLLASIQSLWQQRDAIHPHTLSLATLVFILLLLARYPLKTYLKKKHLDRTLSEKTSGFIVRLMPLLVVIISIILSYTLSFHAQGIATIGRIPTTLPPLSLPNFTVDILLQLLPSAALIALIGFVSSASLGIQFGRLRHEPFDTNRELKAQGLANLGGAFFSSFPVSGGFSRTAINVDAGAKTPLAGVFAALVMIAAILVLGRFLAPLPYAVLGASIMASVVSLIDTDTLKTALKTDKADAASFAVTCVMVLLLGINIGLVTGLLFSFGTLIWRSSQPHVAIVGQVGNTGHFRNQKRHQVTTYDNLIIFRIDESLFYGNAASVRRTIEKAIHNKPTAEHVILMFSSVNHIDLAAQDMLHELDHDLVSQQKTLHLSFVKGPIMDKLKHTRLYQDLSGRVFLNTKAAVEALKTDDSPEYML